MKNQLKNIYIVAFLLSITAAMPADLFVSSMPLISKLMLCNSHIVQLTMTLFILGFALAQFFYGPLSDYYGRKKIILISLSIGIVGGVVCALSHSIALLLIGRLLQGIGASGSLSIPRAIFRDISSGISMSRAISYLSAIVEAVIALSPMTGGFIVQYFNWQADFYILIFMNGIALISVVFLLPETNSNIKTEKIKIMKIAEEYASLVHQKFLFYTWCGCAGYTNLMLYFTISPFIFQNNFHVTPAYYGLLTLLVSGSLVVGAMINTRWVTHFGIDKMLLFASILSFFAGSILLIAVMAFHVSIVIILIFAILSGFSSAFFFPNGVSGALLHAKRNVGLTSALYGGLQISASFIICYIVTEFIPLSAIEKLSVISILLGFIPMMIMVWNTVQKRDEIISAR